MMKTPNPTKKMFPVALIVATLALTLNAHAQAHGGGGGGGMRGPGGPGGPRPGGLTTTEGGEQGEPPHHVPPILGALDANHDHVISANEIANASGALLKLDKNHDGQLTPDELHPPRPQKQDASSSSSSSTTEPPPLPEGEGNGPEGERPHPKFPLMEALDADHDGTLSADEIKNAPEALKTLDKNGDGKLTPDEFAPPRPPKGEGSGELMPMPTPSES